MGIRTGLCLLACCCAALTACTANAPKGPDTTVSTPAVGRPPAPQSVQAALSSEAFTPYAGVDGANGDDGLAPGETIAALHTACMNDAGYSQYANNTPYAIIDLDMQFTQPFGGWGYIGTAEAAQSGFNVGTAGGTGFSDPPGLSAGAQAAAGKCSNISTDFENAQFATSLAGIQTMSNAIGNDVAQDPGVKNATKAWSACMARNGYAAANPSTGFNQAIPSSARHGGGPNPVSGLTPAQNKAQIAAAVADAGCTRASDLAGIYFAVQASYAQQLVTANQQALGAGVRQYKANYAKELAKLPALLRTTSATNALPGPHGNPGAPGG
jgi:hypothetical protein